MWRRARDSNPHSATVRLIPFSCKLFHFIRVAALDSCIQFHQFPSFAIFFRCNIVASNNFNFIQLDIHRHLFPTPRRSPQTHQSASRTVHVRADQTFTGLCPKAGQGRTQNTVRRGLNKLVCLSLSARNVRRPGHQRLSPFYQDEFWLPPP